jgi:hypothetical protein
VVCFCRIERDLSEGFVRWVDRWGVMRGRLVGLVWGGRRRLLQGRSVGGEGGEDGGEAGIVVHSSGCWEWWLRDSAECRIARRGE